MFFTHSSDLQVAPRQVEVGQGQALQLQKRRGIPRRQPPFAQGFGMAKGYEGQVPPRLLKKVDSIVPTPPAGGLGLQSDILLVFALIRTI